MAARRKKAVLRLDVDGPAKITALHVLDRPATDGDMRPITGTAAWRKLTHLQAAYRKGQLQGGKKYTAEDRRDAGQDYTAIFDAAEAPGKDSTQALNAIRGGSGGSSSGALAKASSELACIHSHMGQRDREIIIKICGEGYSPAEAVRHVCGDYRDTVSARFREALDALCDAMTAARKRPGAVDMRRRA
jgi:hypothetical protein